MLVSVNDKQLQRDTLTQSMICEKAREINGDLFLLFYINIKQTPFTSTEDSLANLGITVVRHGEQADTIVKLPSCLNLLLKYLMKIFTEQKEVKGIVIRQDFFRKGLRVGPT